MNIRPLENLQRDAHFERWIRSAPIEIGYFDGLMLPFVLHEMESDPVAREADIFLPGLEDQPALTKLERAIGSFLRLGVADRNDATPYVFRHYQRYSRAVKAAASDFVISDASKVWEFVTPSEIRVSRRHWADGLFYFEIICGCRWDIEHGLVVIYRNGSTLSRVSEQDGHLTTADAISVPDECDPILYEG